MWNSFDPLMLGTIATGWDPELVTVTTCVVLVAPTSTLPKGTVTLSIDSVPAGGGPSGPGIITPVSDGAFASTEGVGTTSTAAGDRQHADQPQASRLEQPSKFLEHSSCNSLRQ